MECIISLGGQKLSSERFYEVYKKEMFLIGVDSGCEFFEELKLLPNLVLGDFDSINPKLLEKYQEKAVEMKSFPTVKDQTDGELALKEAVLRGFEKIHIFGAYGMAEVDHVLANMFLLKEYPQGIIYLPEEKITSGTKGNYMFSQEEGRFFSIIPLEKSSVLLNGFLYNGKFQEDLGTTKLLRNRLVKEKCSVEVFQGKVLFIQRIK